MALWQKKRILVTVKAYPNPSKQYVETVCTAGITIDSKEWIRIYPVPFRDLDSKKKFKKYDIIEANIKKATGDTRPESFKVDADTIRVIGNVGPENNWVKRNAYLIPLVSSSMCEIEERCKSNNLSLGMFKPRLPLKFTCERINRPFKPGALAGYSQLSLFNPIKKVLDRIPYVFRYEYHCQGVSTCRGHKQCILDWEIAEAYRNWKINYPIEKELLDKIREKWLETMFAKDRNSYLMVGNQHRFKTFMVLGVYWPPAKGSAINQMEMAL